LGRQLLTVCGRGFSTCFSWLDRHCGGFRISMHDTDIGGRGGDSYSMLPTRCSRYCRGKGKYHMYWEFGSYLVYTLLRHDSASGLCIRVLACLPFSYLNIIKIYMLLSIGIAFLYLGVC
jgi:hypothetical protein